MSTNAEKTYIEAFPISTSDELDDKLLTEKNITNIIKHICGRNSFIIGELIEDSKTYIEFILDGYYFKIERPGTATAYAYITYDNDIFESLNITSSIPDNTTSFLQLLSGSKLIEANKVRFGANLVGIKSIRCVWS